jgi:O-antigen/teichoic acid export membrane protein
MTRSIPSIAVHYLRYSVGSFLVLIAGFVSFPILTRLLDNTQYGILGYFDTWIGLALGVAKLGAQHSILRYYPHNADARGMASFATNLVLIPAVVSFGLWVLATSILTVVSWLSPEPFSMVFWFALLTIPLGVSTSFSEMVLRAREQSMLTVLLRVIARWLELVLILGAVELIARSALAVYGGRLISATVMMAIYAWFVWRHLPFRRSAMQGQPFFESVRYGFPLLVTELAGVALISIDRVMLKFMTHDYAEVGVYTIGYSLAMTVSIFLNATLYEAFNPVANRVYETEGPAALRALKDRVLLPMVYCSFAIAAGLWVVGSDALLALSGPTKAASAPVFVLIGINYALFPILDLGGYGLLLQKRSMLILLLTAAAAVLNVALNLVLIPKMGVMGAVYATFISYGALGVSHCVFCPKHLLRLPDLRATLSAVGLAILLIAVARGTDLFGITSHWGRMAAMVPLTIVLYVLPALLLDGRLRAFIKFPRAQAV